MASKNTETDFAPAERLDDGEVYLQTIKFLGKRDLIKILHILPNLVVVLNKQRQVIFANDAFMNAIDVEKFEDSLGQRPGELFLCVHSLDNTNGCGTGKECRHCGAVLTVLKAQETGRKEERNAIITVNKDGKLIPLHLQVIATPITVDNEIFYFVVITEK